MRGEGRAPTHLEQPTLQLYKHNRTRNKLNYSCRVSQAVAGEMLGRAPVA